MAKSPATDTRSQDLSCTKVMKVDESEVAVAVVGRNLPSGVFEASGAAPAVMDLAPSQRSAMETEDKPRSTPRAALSLLTVQLSCRSAGSLARLQQPAHSQPLARLQPRQSSGWGVPGGGKGSIAVPIEMVKAGPRRCIEGGALADVRESEHPKAEDHFDRVSRSYPTYLE